MLPLQFKSLLNKIQWRLKIEIMKWDWLHNAVSIIF